MPDCAIIKAYDYMQRMTELVRGLQLRNSQRNTELELQQSVTPTVRMPPKAGTGLSYKDSAPQSVDFGGSRSCLDVSALGFATNGIAIQRIFSC